MPGFKELYRADMARYRNLGADRYVKRLLRLMRRAQTGGSSPAGLVFRFLYRRHCSRRAVEIPSRTKIGKGLYLGHVYNITISPDAVIGENCNIHKGVTIGRTNRGEKKGAPNIGSRVWIGVNAAIVGGITIGDDVLIAPNSFVNRDVPPHSVVLGNPCIIKPVENATAGYINDEA